MAEESRGPQVAAVVVAMTTVATIIVALRLYVRLLLVRCSGLEDWITCVAMAFSIVTAVMMLGQVEYGLGKHIEDVPLADQVVVLQDFYISVIFYNCAVGLNKLSILLVYLRIFKTKTIQKACKISFVIVLMFTIEITVISVFDCTPIPYFWDKTIPGGHCVNFAAMWFSHASVNIALDLLLISLPMPVLNSLKIPKKQKIALMGIFALGAFSCVTSVLRLHSIYVVSNSTDVTYDNVGAAVWSCIELNTAIMCASLPTFKALVSRFFPRLLGSTGLSSWTRRSRGMKNHVVLQSLDQNTRSDGARSRHDLEMGMGGSMHTINENGILEKCILEKGSTGCDSIGKSSTGRGSSMTAISEDDHFSHDENAINAFTIVQQRPSEAHVLPPAKSFSYPHRTDSSERTVIR